MKSAGILSLFLATSLFTSLTLAGGRYSCCLKRENGEIFKRKGIASSFYHGTVSNLCQSIAIEENAQVCEQTKSQNAIDLDFVRTKPTSTLDLSIDRCLAYPCRITIHHIAGTLVAATAQGPLQCSVRKIIHNGSGGPEAHTLTVNLGSLNYRDQNMGSCQVVMINGSGIDSIAFDTNIDRSNLQEYLDRAEKLKKAEEE